MNTLVTFHWPKLFPWLSLISRGQVPTKEEKLEFWLLSDLLEEQKGLTLELQLTDFYGKVQKKVKHAVTAPANRSVKVLDFSLEDFGTPDQRRNSYLLCILRDKKGEKVAEEPYFFFMPKELNLPKTVVDSRIKVKDGVCEVTLKSDALAKDLFIEVPIHGARFSDNFFDLLPGKSRKIMIFSPEIKAGKAVELKIKYLQAISRNK